MKRIILSVVAAIAAISVSSAQNYMVVNSESVFKSLTEYVEAISTLDTLSEQYQKAVDEKFQAVESMYNNYQAQKASMSATSRSQTEQAILAAEKSATDYQQSIFGNEGSLMQKRLELIQPIQKRVFAAVEEYAETNGFDLVLDIASNANVLYYSSAVNRTEQVIKALK